MQRNARAARAHAAPRRVHAARRQTCEQLRASHEEFRTDAAVMIAAVGSIAAA
jgi:hypothetical protein